VNPETRSGVKEDAMSAAHYDKEWRGFLPKADLDALINELKEEGYTVLGPRLVEDVISLRPIESAEDIARGVQDEQEPGNYRLTEGDPELYFQYVVGPDGPRRYLFPPNLRLFSMVLEDGRFNLEQGPPQPPKFAFLGLRPCEVAALQVHDRVFGANGHDHGCCEEDSYYRSTRRSSFVIAVNCTRPDGNCFCESMGTGPEVSDGYDLALTELRAGFVVQQGSDKGAELAAKLPLLEPSPSQLELAELRLELAKNNMGREFDTEGVPELLAHNLEHHRWEEVAQRCLGCGNCTQVCPTCFCSTVEDQSNLSGRRVTRLRQWDSCYTHQFSYTTSGPVRNTIRSRYRQWLTHKLSNWHEQFGCSGCVGCGRCITWCPVGIDLTEEVDMIRRESHPAESRADARSREVFL
jgi:ferredoxin